MSRAVDAIKSSVPSLAAHSGKGMAWAAAAWTAPARAGTARGAARKGGPTLTAILALALLALPTMAAEIPDNDLTPGVVAEDGHDVAEICTIKDGLSYSKRHRATPDGLKAMIRKRDGCDPRNSEVDHRCPLALGCADVVYNLWCQPGPAAGVTWNYHDKDRLEVYAWDRLCKQGTISPDAAQKMFIAPADWRASYCLVFSDDPRCGKP